MKQATETATLPKNYLTDQQIAEQNKLANNYIKELEKSDYQSVSKDTLKKARRELYKREDFYSYAQLHAFKAITTLVHLLDSKSESVRFNAASKLLDKTLPDLKALEVNGEMRQAMSLNVVQFGATDLLAKHLQAKQEALEATTAPNTVPSDNTLGQDTATTSENVDYATRDKATSDNSMLHDSVHDTPTPPTGHMPNSGNSEAESETLKGGG